MKLHSARCDVMDVMRVKMPVMLRCVRGWARTQAASAPIAGLCTMVHGPLEIWPLFRACACALRCVWSRPVMVDVDGAGPKGQSKKKKKQVSDGWPASLAWPASLITPATRTGRWLRA